MHLRKRVIAGIAAVVVIFVGAFAQAMFSEGGVSPLSRGWDAISSVLRPPADRRASTPSASRRFADWQTPDHAPVHPLGDANSARKAPSNLTAEQLDELRASSRDPLSFGLDDDDQEGEDNASVLGKIAQLSNDGARDPSQRGSQRFGRSSGVNELGDRVRGASSNGGSSSFHSVAFAAMGGGAGGSVFVDPTQEFGGVVVSNAAETVATPVPPAAVLFVSVWAAIVGRNRLRRV